MESKITLNPFKYILVIEHLKQILLLLVFANKKMFIRLSVLFYTFVLLLNTSFIYSQSNSCKATLQVENDRFAQSVRPEGTSYILQISNTGTSNSTYKLSSSNINSSCSNNDGSSSSDNVNLNFSFSDMTLNPISEISLAPGQTTLFLVNVKVPPGTTVSKWNCTEIIATATACASYKVSTVLHTLVSNPDEE